jgi:hypothetical protein
LGFKDGFNELRRHEFCRGIDWDAMLKKRVRNMPPVKMNPAGSIEGIKAEYFDMEYTQMTPGLSLHEERPGSNQEENLEDSVVRCRPKRAKSMKIDPSQSSFDSRDDDERRINPQIALAINNAYATVTYGRKEPQTFKAILDSKGPEIFIQTNRDQPVKRVNKN